MGFFILHHSRCDRKTLDSKDIARINMTSLSSWYKKDMYISSFFMLPRDLDINIWLCFHRLGQYLEKLKSHPWPRPECAFFESYFDGSDSCIIHCRATWNYKLPDWDESKTKGWTRDWQTHSHPSSLTSIWYCWPSTICLDLYVG